VATPKAIQRNFGRVLRDFRDDAGISQERLANDSGLHKNYVGEIERGLKSPSLKTITALASTLGVLPSELLREAEKRASS
jgi:transcriptional regulator with XRE-family HTH domain